MNSPAKPRKLHRAKPGARFRPTPRVSLARKVAFLSSPAAYPDAPRRVERRETHMSYVFLTDDFAYKLKKPVRYAALDYRSLRRRFQFCREELRLNRRLAARVYLDLVPLACRAGATLHLGTGDVVVDWLVRMQRLPDDRMLDQAIARGTAFAPLLIGAADHLAAFYRAATPEYPPAREYLARFGGELIFNRRVLLADGDAAAIAVAARVIDGLQQFVAEEFDTLLERLRSGCIVEGHGDLRPEHIYLAEPPRGDRLPGIRPSAPPARSVPRNLRSWRWSAAALMAAGRRAR